MPRVLRLILVLLAIAVTATAARAQTGYITGTVTDAATGSGVAGATVVARDGAGTVVGDATSGGDGGYRISNVPPGNYTIEVRAIGYRVAGRQTIVVVSGSPSMVSFDLEPSATRLNPVQVTAGGREEKATEAPASISVVTRELVNERPSVTVVDHVRALPGVDVVSGGIIQSNVVARGFNNIFSGTLLTLTDYRFAFVPSLRVNVPYLSPTTNEDIERIEVVLGPGSALYGPNAASGVMHVITRSPFDSKGTTITLDAGNRSVLRTALRHAGTATDRFGYKVSFEYFKAEDWHSRDEFELSLVPTVQRDFDLKKFGGEVRLDFRPTENTTLIGTYGRAQAGSAIEPTGLGAAQVKDWVFNTYQLRAANGRLFAQVFFNQSDAGETFLLRNRNRADSGVIVDKSTQLVFQAQHGFAIGGRQDFIYGIDYQFTNPKTDGTINGRNERNDDVTERGAYLHSKTSLLPTVDLVAAIRVDKHSRLEDAVWSPRAGIVWQPSEDQGFRATYNRAFSTPSTNNLFLDLAVASIVIPGTPGYTVRTLGTPSRGFQFNRSCTGGVGNGLCMRSPFIPTQPFVPANAGGIYQTVALPVALANGLQAQLQAQFQAAGQTPAQAAGTAQAVVNRLQTAPGPTTVGTDLRTLNPTTGRFDRVNESSVQDLTAIMPTTTESYELGYRGALMSRLSLQVDLWSQRRKNFVSPLLVSTPNVFLDSPSLVAYLTTTLTPTLGAPTAAVVAQGIAAGMSGIPNSPTSATRGIPLGVVNFDNTLNNPTDIVLAYRNFGTVDLWGSDLGAEFAVTDHITVGGTYSYASKDFFPAEASGFDIALNAPAGKGSVTGRYRSERNGFSSEVRNRWVKGFPGNSGVYIGEIPSYSLLDAGISLRPNLFPNAMISLNATNLLDKEHIEFIGGATIGRLIMTRLQYTF
jgi:iron complex outermembrane receptor protein